MVLEIPPMLLDALRHTSGFILGASATHRGRTALEPLLQLQPWQRRRMRVENLHAHAAIRVGREQLLNPADILTALFHAVMPNPQGDDGNEARFLFGNHHQASSEP
jgi:hypothetical protein